MPGRKPLLCLLAVGALAGCSDTSPGGPVPFSAPVIESSHVDPNSGNLIALWMPMRGPRGGTVLEPVLVAHPYAVYICWPSEEYEPNSAGKRLFIFHDNVARKSYQTKDYDTFLAVVARQPRNIALAQIESCSMARCYMPDEEWARLEKVLAAGGRRWVNDSPADDRFETFCYCESIGEFIYPGDRK